MDEIDESTIDKIRLNMQCIVKCLGCCSCSFADLNISIYLALSVCHSVAIHGEHMRGMYVVKNGHDHQA